VPGHPVYGLGGCAVLARDLDPIIRDPWREVTKEGYGIAGHAAVAVIFESSQRADRLVGEAFEGFGLSEIEIADRAVTLNPNSYHAWSCRGWV
jgi:hypothetical protein